MMQYPLGQFVLTKETDAVPAGWDKKHFNGYILATCPSLPVVAFADGFVVGWPVGIDRVDPLDAEKSIYQCSGRWIAFIGGRVYLDASGSLAAVFSPSDQMVASTPSLIPKSSRTPVDQELIDDLGYPDRSYFFPFGLTPRTGINRILPNHYLDLADWETLRHWPAVKIDRMQSVQSAASAIGENIRSTIESLHAEYPLILSLTAGRDSRVLLACSRGLDLPFFTRAVDEKAARDIRIARRLSRRFGLQHTVHPYQSASSSKLEAWQTLVGYCVAGRWWKSASMIEKIDHRQMFLPGLALETGRGYYWRQQDNDQSVIDADLLIRRMRMPVTDRLVDLARQWLKSTDGFGTFQMLDLAYIELRLGCWAGPLHYGLLNTGLCASPASSRANFVSMMSTPAKTRRAGLIEPEIITQMWPELLSTPFNKDSLLQRLKNRLKRLLR